MKPVRSLLDFVHRDPEPAPWSEGDNIPWDDPAFSERMLEAHLSQDHDLASRRVPQIARHAEWISNDLLGSRPRRVLDLACGPGLYAQQLAGRGCEVTGIDFSPASIRHAQRIAREDGLACTFRQGDLRDGGFGEDFDLAMLIYGQFNVFPRDRAMAILKEAHRALRPGGTLLLELQSEQQIREAAAAAPSWYTAGSGLFSPSPHLVLEEHFWDEDARASTARFSVVDAETAAVRSYALSNEAYSERELHEALEAAGFASPRSVPSLSGAPENGALDLPVVIARR
jgi:SAM-dependent methyltransferase